MDQSLTIEKLISNGCGLARQKDGSIVFIPQTLPPETVSVEAYETRKNVAWATHFSLLSSSEDRCEPPCIHDRDCGGCSLLFVKRDRELSYKIRILEDAIRRIGKNEPVHIEGYDFNLTPSRYRGHLHAHDGILGFHAKNSNQIVPIPRCLVLPDQMQSTLPDLEEAARRSDFSGSIYFACADHPTQLALEIVGKKKDAGIFFQEIKQRRPDMVTGLVVRSPNGRTWQKWGRPFISVTWNQVKVRLAPRQFFQSNPNSWPFFFDRVRSFVEKNSLKRLWDAHAGSGFLCSALEPMTLICTEPSALGYEQLQRQENHTTHNMTVLKSTAEAALSSDPEWFGALDSIILDPPRTGLSNKLLQSIVSSGPNHLLYVSCDAATFARDLKGLSPSYRLVAPMIAMNVNPGTMGLEVIAEFERME